LAINTTTADTITPPPSSAQAHLQPSPTAAAPTFAATTAATTAGAFGCALAGAFGSGCIADHQRAFVSV
ncbi:hypothetical protein Tco_0650606, partial [Tanacetum coccineum]